MNFDIGKLVNAITIGMALVQKLKGSAPGSEKAADVVSATPAIVSALETGIDKDVLDDAAVVQAELNLIAAIKNFANVVKAVKAAKGSGQPVNTANSSVAVAISDSF